MKLIRLDHTGHTDVEVNADEAIRQIEAWMNEVGEKRLTVLAEPRPGAPSQRVKDLEDLLRLPDTTQVFVFPQLVGG